MARFQAIVLSSLALAACSLAVSREEPVRIGIIGDQTGDGAKSREASYAVLEQAVQRLARERLAAVLHTGDLVETGDLFTNPVDDATYIADFKRAANILGRLPVPWYLAAGDHDVNPPAREVDSIDKSRESLFLKLYGQTAQGPKDRLYYSFDVAGYHFVALFSQETKHVDPRWGTILLAGISDAQLKWLAEDLQHHRSARGIVVFLHQPLWYVWPRWSHVHSLLRRYPVVAVIAGHFHYNQDDGTLDGIRYAVVGAAGGSTKQGSPRAGHLHHVTLLTLQGRDVSFAVLPVDSSPAMALTPRADMDRVQMLDLVLGGLHTFEKTSPVRRKGDTLVADCKTGAPAHLSLVPIGNPLDVPLEVTVRLISHDVTLSSAGFAAGACLKTIGAERCELSRGARVTVANLSSVDFTWGCGSCDQVPPPLWSARPVLSSAASAPERVTLDIRLSFQGASADLFLHREVSTKVEQCP